MDLRSLFVLYIDYCESKSSQKRAQSPVPNTVSFIQHELRVICSYIGYLSSVAKMYQKLDECFMGSCCTNNERPWHCWGWYRTGKSMETMVKVPTGYSILMIMISLSPLGLRVRDVLIEAVEAYYGWTFLDQIKTQKKYATFLLIIWLLLKEFHRESHWSWDGERFYNRPSKIPQKESRGWFSWTFELFIREA